MKIEKLRNNHKKEIIIGTILTVVIGGALTFRLTHSKYRVTQSIDLGSGVINYKVPDFKIMAMYQQKDGSTCTEDNCYSELTDRMPSSGYVINTSKSYCTLDNVNHDNEAKVYTENGKHVFENLKKNDKCYLYFDKIMGITIDNILAKYSSATEKSSFSSLATSDEGVFKAEDGMYGSSSTNKIYSYYWRGAATTNHVIFAGSCWRIVRINGDKTMRLIYNGPIIDSNTCTGNGTNSDAVIFPNNDSSDSSINLNHYSTTNGKYDNPSYVGWKYTLSSQRPSSTTSGTDSNAKVQTETWYNNNIGNNTTYSAKLADGKFCNDRSIGRGSWTISTSSSFDYAAQIRLIYNNIPTFNCSHAEDVYTLKVGAITGDEVAFAGGVYPTSNPSYYMYTGQGYWTMSPNSSTKASVFRVDSDGSLANGYVDGTLGLRPVINLNADTTFSSGADGTKDKPYIVQ